MCGQVDDKMCEDKLCVSKWCEDKLCVDKLCVEGVEAHDGRRTGGGREADGGIQNQKQEPHRCGELRVMIFKVFLYLRVIFLLSLESTLVI